MLPGLGHDPGHDRPRRHGQRLGRRARRAVILQLLQSWFLQDLTRLAARAGPADRQSTGCSRSIWPQSIELIFGVILVIDDAVPPRGADPGDAADAGADASSSRRPHAGRGGFAAPSRGIEPANAAGRRQPLLEIAGVTRALRRPRRAQGSSTSSCRARLDRRGDRPERLGQDRRCSTLITGLDAPDAGQIRFDGADITGLPPHQIARARHRPHLPEHAPVHQPDRAGKRAGRPCMRGSTHRARSAPSCARRARRARGGGGARARARDPRRCSATGCCRAPTSWSTSLSYANRRRVEIARALASRPEAAAARRADRRHEPGRDAGAGRADQEPARAWA